MGGVLNFLLLLLLLFLELDKGRLRIDGPVSRHLGLDHGIEVNDLALGLDLAREGLPVPGRHGKQEDEEN